MDKGMIDEDKCNFYLAPEALQYCHLEIIPNSESLVTAISSCKNSYFPHDVFENEILVLMDDSSVSQVEDSETPISDGLSAIQSLEHDEDELNQVSSAAVMSSICVSNSSTFASNRDTGEFIQSAENTNNATSSKNMSNLESGENEGGIPDTLKLANVNSEIESLRRQLDVAMDKKKRLESKNEDAAGQSKRPRHEKHKEEESDEGLFSCPQTSCGYASKRRRYIKLHMQTHSQEKKFSCPEANCGYKSKTSVAMRKHKIGHSEKKNKCNVCYKMFAMKYDLEIHIRHHTGEKPFKCTEPNCKYSAAQKAHLDSHRYFIHKKGSAKAISVTCQVCKTSLEDSKALAAHMTRIHNLPKIILNRMTGF